jgi:hypothetical protein
MSSVAGKVLLMLLACCQILLWWDPLAFGSGSGTENSLTGIKHWQGTAFSSLRFVSVLPVWVALRHKPLEALRGYVLS